MESEYHREFKFNIQNEDKLKFLLNFENFKNVSKRMPSVHFLITFYDFFSFFCIADFSLLLDTVSSSKLKSASKRKK